MYSLDVYTSLYVLHDSNTFHSRKFQSHCATCDRTTHWLTEIQFTSFFLFFSPINSERTTKYCITYYLRLVRTSYIEITPTRLNIRVFKFVVFLWKVCLVSFRRVAFWGKSFPLCPNAGAILSHFKQARVHICYILLLNFRSSRIYFTMKTFYISIIIHFQVLTYIFSFRIF